MDYDFPAGSHVAAVEETRKMCLVVAVVAKRRQIWPDAANVTTSQIHNQTSHPPQQTGQDQSPQQTITDFASI